MLPLIQAVIDEHSSGDSSSGEGGRRDCARCRVPQPCTLLEFAIDALDLVLRTYRRDVRAVWPGRGAVPLPAMLGR